MERYIECASTWLAECSASHESCTKTPMFSNINGSIGIQMDYDGIKGFPKRLLDLSVPEKVRLIQCSDLYPGSVNEGGYFNTEYEGDVEMIRYVALSHRWGLKEEFVMTKQNVEELQVGFSIDRLPKTFREAAMVTLGLGIKYIWIDSVCIAQDKELNPEVDVFGTPMEWLQESRRMAAVYGNAVLTISAQDSFDSESGLFVQDMEECKRNELNRRGWVMQERMIPARSLLFSANSMAWECRQCDATFDRQELRERTRKNTDLLTHPKELYTFFRDFRLAGQAISDSTIGDYINTDRRLRTPPQEYFPFFRVWWRFLYHYTSRQLTNGGDKLLALSGIATTFQRNLRLTVHYGLFVEYFLMQEIAWYVDPGWVPGTRWQHGWTAPTWAWAHIEKGRICNGIWKRWSDDNLPVMMMKPWVRTPRATGFDWTLPHFQAQMSFWNNFIDIKADLRKGTVTTIRDEVGNPKFEVELNEAGRFSDQETHKFWPDAVAEFPLNKAVPVTCALICHFKTNLDIRIVMQKMEVVPGHDGNATGRADDVGVTLEWPDHTQDGIYRKIHFRTNPQSASHYRDDETKEEEEFANTRSFLRLGYLETSYEVKRNEAEIDEDLWHKFIRLF